MEENTFSLKCSAQAVKANYDSGDGISVIKVYPERNSDIKIIFGKHRVTINDEKLRNKREKRSV